MKRATRSKPESVKVGNVTVKLYKRTRPTATGKQRTIYEVADYTGGARRFRGFKDHAAAIAKAKEIAQNIASGQVEAASMTSADAASYGRAVEFLRPTGISLELAAETFAKCFEILGGNHFIEAANFYRKHRPQNATPRTVAEVVAELVAAKRALKKSPDYVNDLRQRLNRFATSYAVSIASVTHADVQRFLDGLKLGAQSQKNFRTVIGTLFQFAEARGYIGKDCNPVEHTEKIKADGGEIQIFTPDELSRLLAAASEDFLPLVAIGAFAGLRAAEAERIEWQDIDLAGGYIKVAKAKAKRKKRRLVPIQPNLVQWLAPYAARSGRVWARTSNDLQDARAACVKAAGVPWKNNGLRHSYASYRVEVTQNVDQVALEMGNSADMIFEHYRELVTADDAAKWFAIAPEQPAEKIIQLTGTKG